MDRTRLRAPNFTASDNMLLCGILAKFKQVIENKKTDGASLRQKHAAWLEVVKIYNANTTGCTRTLESLQQTYKNLKKKAKLNASDTKMGIPGKRKLDFETPSEQIVAEKLIKLDNEKMESVEIQHELLRTQKMEPVEIQHELLRTQKIDSDEIQRELLRTQKLESVELQNELLRTQLEDQKEKLEHNRRLRAMEVEDLDKQYKHNDILRKLELERHNTGQQ